MRLEGHFETQIIGALVAMIVGGAIDQYIDGRRS